MSNKKEKKYETKIIDNKKIIKKGENPDNTSNVIDIPITLHPKPKKSEKEK